MRCPICRDRDLIVATDLRGGVDGRCTGCEGRWCGMHEAVALGLFRSEAEVSRSVALAACPQCRGPSLAPLDAARPVPQRPLRCTDCGGVWMHGATVRALRPSARIGGDVRGLRSEAQDVGRDAGREARHQAGHHHGFLARLKATYGADHEADAPLPDDIETRPLSLAIALPVAALLVWVLDSIGIVRFLLDSTLRMGFHEAGHAVASWLTGRLAIPVPFLTFTADDSSLLGYALTLGLIAAMVLLGLRRRLPFWIALGALGLCLLIAKGVVASTAEQSTWITWSGVGGEFALGTVCILAFFFRLYHRPSWDLMRYVVLLAGLVALLPSWRQWRGVAAGEEPFPLGALLLGPEDGDMNRLLAAGWTQAQVIESYLHFAQVCAALILGLWLWTAWRAWMSRGSTG